MKKVIEQENDWTLEIFEGKDGDYLILQSGDRVYVEKPKIPEFVAAFHPEIEQEKFDFAKWCLDNCRKSGEKIFYRNNDNPTDISELIELYKKDNGK